MKLTRSRLDIYMYINGVLEGSATGIIPDLSDETFINCFIGRSAWFMSTTDVDANALFDDIKIFKRALTQDEILNDSLEKFY